MPKPKRRARPRPSWTNHHHPIDESVWSVLFCARLFSGPNWLTTTTNFEWFSSLGPFVGGFSPWWMKFQSSAHIFQRRNAENLSVSELFVENRASQWLIQRHLLWMTNKLSRVCPHGIWLFSTCLLALLFVCSFVVWLYLGPVSSGGDGGDTILGHDLCVCLLWAHPTQKGPSMINNNTRTEQKQLCLLA